METKVSYEQIEKANKEIETIKLGTKGYAQVNERIKAYRKVYPTGSLTSEIEEIREDYVRIKATATDEQDRIIATGTASERITGDSKKDYINLNSMIENCETSAYGRCLGFAGFGVENAIASAEDMEKATEKSKRYEIYTNMFIPNSEAKKIVKASIMEMMRKMGMTKSGLEGKVQEKLWCDLDDLTVEQLLHIERIIKEANMQSNEWHELYNQNIKIKDVIPENQALIYKSSYYRFGIIALEQAGTDELLRSEIINTYLDMGINLQKEAE